MKSWVRFRASCSEVWITGTLALKAEFYQFSENSPCIKAIDHLRSCVTMISPVVRGLNHCNTWAVKAHSITCYSTEEFIFLLLL